jgi:hypothetical protein
MAQGCLLVITLAIPNVIDYTMYQSILRFSGPVRIEAKSHSSLINRLYAYPIVNRQLLG